MTRGAEVVATNEVQPLNRSWSSEIFGKKATFAADD